MCGRYTFGGVEAFFERFGVRQVGLELETVYNVTPDSDMPVVIREEVGNTVRLMRWGLVPSWKTDGRGGMINARAETVAEKPWFRRAFRQRRCLVPATGFYEWQKTAQGKVPWYFRPSEEHEQLFAFAGLFDSWEGKDGEQRWTYTILTIAANELVRPVHQRMPVMLEREDEAQWLDPMLTDPAVLCPLLRPYPAARMEAYRVSSQVNAGGHEGAGLVQPLLGAEF